MLADLQQGDQQMRQSIRNQGAHGGMTVFLPMMSQGNGQGSHGSGGNRPGEQDDDDDDDQQPTDSRNDRDPLGRKTGDTRQGMDNDTHVPDNASRERHARSNRNSAAATRIAPARQRNWNISTGCCARSRRRGRAQAAHGGSALSAPTDRRA